MTNNELYRLIGGLPGDYEVLFSVPGGGDYSNMELDIETVEVDDKHRRVMLS